MFSLSPIARITTSAALAAATAAAMPPGSGASTPEPSVTLTEPLSATAPRTPLARSIASALSP